MACHSHESPYLDGQLDDQNFFDYCNTSRVWRQDASPTTPLTMAPASAALPATPLSKSAHSPPRTSSGGATLDADSAAATSLLQLLRLLHQGRYTAPAWNPLPLSPSARKQFQHALKKEENLELRHWFEYKIQYDYDGDNIGQEFVLRTSTPFHGLFVSSLQTCIRKELDAAFKRNGSSFQALVILDDLRPSRSGRVFLLSKREKAPDFQFFFRKAGFPPFVGEVSSLQT